MGWVGLGQSADGFGWIGSHKMDPWTTLGRLTVGDPPHGPCYGSAAVWTLSVNSASMFDVTAALSCGKQQKQQ